MQRVSGFVIYCAEGLFHLAAPTETYPKKFKRWKTLWFGNAATIFKSRRAARRAIGRTQAYRDLFLGHAAWPWLDRAKIFPVGGRP